MHHTIPTQKMPKGVLRRMPRVRSDDMHGESEEQTDVKEKIPSPIGAGLPLLQRLRLLKEKQVNIISINLFNNTHVIHGYFRNII